MGSVQGGGCFFGRLKGEGSIHSLDTTSKTSKMVPSLQPHVQWTSRTLSLCVHFNDSKTNNNKNVKFILKQSGSQ